MEKIGKRRKRIIACCVAAAFMIGTMMATVLAKENMDVRSKGEVQAGQEILPEQETENNGIQPEITINPDEEPADEHNAEAELPAEGEAIASEKVEEDDGVLNETGAASDSGSNSAEEVIPAADDTEPQPSEMPTMEENSPISPENEIRKDTSAESETSASSINERPKYTEPAIFTEGVVPRGNDDDIALSEREKSVVNMMLPAGLDPIRKEIVLKAYSLVGKVNYFWGGKSTAIGWDERWGNIAIVGSEGSSMTGKAHSYGLDCSGYVLWCMVNAYGDGEIINSVGYGTASQWRNSEPVSAEEALPGDLVFYGAPETTARNHVGIIVSKDWDGKLFVVHCSSDADNVVVSEMSEAGFREIRRLSVLNKNTDEVSAPATGKTMLGELPIKLTEEQAYRAAVMNGWPID